MAKMYYNQDETLAKLSCTEDRLKELVREGKLREFRDAGKLNYRVDEVDKLVGEAGGGSDDSAPLQLEDTGEIPLAPIEDEGGQDKAGGSDAPIDLSADSGPLSLDMGSGELSLEDSGGGTSELKLEDSGGEEVSLGGSGSAAGEVSLEDSGGGSGGLTLEDSGAPAPTDDQPKSDSSAGKSGGGDVMSLDEVDKDAVEGMKKDDTVITNIGISVFDDDDLEIAADPMAKTLMTGGDEHLGLDGSGGGSGLLDLTRESDDTSLGAELLEGIDMGDTAETEVPTAPEPAGEPAAVASADEPVAPEPEFEEMGAPVVAAAPAGVVEAASPVFTGLLAGAALLLVVAQATAIALMLDAWPALLGELAKQFYALLGGGAGVLGLGALAGYLVGKQAGSAGSAGKAAPAAAKGKKAKGKKSGDPLDRYSDAQKRTLMDLGNDLQAAHNARQTGARLDLMGSKPGMDLLEQLSDEELAFLAQVQADEAKATEAAKKGDHKTAVKLYQKVVDRAGWNAIAMMSLGVEQAQAGNQKKAAKTLEAALKLDPQNERIRQNLEAIKSAETSKKKK